MVFFEEDWTKQPPLDGVSLLHLQCCGVVRVWVFDVMGGWLSLVWGEVLELVRGAFFREASLTEEAWILRIMAGMRMKEATPWGAGSVHLLGEISVLSRS